MIIICIDITIKLLLLKNEDNILTSFPLTSSMTLVIKRRTHLHPFF